MMIKKREIESEKQRRDKKNQKRRRCSSLLSAGIDYNT